MDATYIDLTVRLSLALILGGAIGIEREYRAKEAGFRTHFLVALGSALFCVVSQYGFGFDLKDSSRVAAQVVSGIGFLGAGLLQGERMAAAAGSDIQYTPFCELQGLLLQHRHLLNFSEEMFHRHFVLFEHRGEHT